MTFLVLFFFIFILYLTLNNSIFFTTFLLYRMRMTLLVFFIILILFLTLLFHFFIRVSLCNRMRMTLPFLFFIILILLLTLSSISPRFFFKKIHSPTFSIDPIFILPSFSRFSIQFQSNIFKFILTGRD